MSKKALRETTASLSSVKMSEAQLQAAVIECAQRLGWMVAHFRPAQTSKGWRTPVEADGKGFPDLVMARDGRVVFAEVKDAKRGLTSAQMYWQNALDPGWGSTYSSHVWRPKDWLDGTVESVLR